VTLLFLGGVPVSALPLLNGAMHGVAATWPPLDILTKGGGGRVRAGDGTVWLSVRPDVRGVIELAGDLASAVDRDVPGIPEPRRAPSGHVTVARRADGRLRAALRDETHGPLRSGWQADRILLMRSFLGKAGARYEAIHEAQLGERTVP
jgi:2'-5' RNA ligase